MKQRLVILGLALVASVSIISGCGTIEVNVDVPDVDPRDVLRGSGDVVTEERAVKEFDRVSLTGAGDVIITQGDEEALTVETDDNLMPYIRTEVKGKTLVLGFTAEGRRKSFRPSKGIKFYLTLKELSGLDLSGAGNVKVSSLEVDRLEIRLSGAGDIQIDAVTAEDLVVHLSGAGNVELAGQVAEQNVQISGAGDYRASKLESQNAAVEVSGAGNAIVWANDSLDARITGVGAVSYYGDPRVTKSVSLVGRLVRMGNQ